VEPALRVLVPVPLDPECPVDNHQLDVAAALPAGLRDGAGLVLGDIPFVVEVLASGGGQGGVQLCGYPFVVASLPGEEFALGEDRCVSEMLR
jgi:hypothetical protein